MIAVNHQPLFPLGDVSVTPRALAIIQESGQKVDEFLVRHARGDWGTIFDAQRADNERAIEFGGEIRSVFRTDNGAKIEVVSRAADSAGQWTTQVQLQVECFE